VPRWVRVGAVDEFREGRGRAVAAESRQVAVFRIGERWFAIGDSCPHQGASLADGMVRGTEVACHRHGWRFDLETGRTPDSSRLCARVFPTRAGADGVFVELPDPPAPDDDEWVAFDPAAHLKPRG